MKYVKYAVTLLVLSVVAACTGLICQLHFMESPLTNSVQVYVADDESSEKFFSNIEKATSSSGAVAFIYILNADNFENNYSFVAYCADSKARDFLKNECLIKSGEYKSVFLSDTIVEIKNLEDYPLREGYIEINYAGSAAEEDAFVEAVNNTLNVTDRSIGEVTSYVSNDVIVLQILVWIIAIAIIGAAGLYEISFKKGETAVKYTLGEKTSVIYLKKVIADTLMFVALGALAFGVSSIFTSSLFSLKITLIMFAVLVAANALCLLPILRVQLSKGFASAYSSSGVLSISYVLKFVTCVLTVMATAFSFGIITQTEDLRNVENYYKKFSDYSFMTVTVDKTKIPPITEESSVDYMSELWYDIYVFKYRLTQELFSQGKVVLQAWIGDTECADGKERGKLFFNRNSREELIEAIPELENVKMNEETMYLIIPEYENYEKDMDSFKQSFAPELNGGSGYMFAHNYEIKVITYKDEVDVFAFNTPENGGGGLYKNPVVCFSNIDESKGTISCVETDYSKNVGSSIFNEYIADLAVYNVSEEEVLEFAAHDGYDLNPDKLQLSNVYDTFLTTNVKTMQALLLAYVILVIMLLLETCMISVVIRMEYTIHAKELAIKKVLGYSIFQRNRKIFVITFGVIGVGLAAALILNGFLELANPALIILGCLLLAAIEAAVILFNIVRIEKSQIVKILKGGSL